MVGLGLGTDVLQLLGRVEREDARPPLTFAEMYILEVLSGPLDGKSWTFDREISIGRDESLVTASITLDRYISRRHAHVREDGGRLFLTDLESTNGIQVRPAVPGLVGPERPAADGTAACQAGVAVTLELGERFLVGRTLLRVVRG